MNGILISVNNGDNDDITELNLRFIPLPELKPFDYKNSKPRKTIEKAFSSEGLLLFSLILNRLTPLRI